MIKELGMCLCESQENIMNVYGEKLLERLPVSGKVYSKKDVLDTTKAFSAVKYIFSTWGMPHFDAEEIKEVFPSLEAVFYAAGTVKDFAKEFLECGVRVFSAPLANAIPVAEFTLAQILLASKGYFALSTEYEDGSAEALSTKKGFYTGNYGIKIGLIGAGMIGRKVIELLHPFDVEVLAYDAFLGEQAINELGAEKASLERVFEECTVVSNHLADKAETRGILRYDLFKRMPPYSTFINTGRGAQVAEDDLVRILSERPDITALLDVTYPEPPISWHPFYTLPNCHLTPHIAGSIGNEVRRMGEYMEKAYCDFKSGIANKCEVKAEMLATMA